MLSTWIIAPVPPAVMAIFSSASYRAPSFVNVTASGIPVIFALINVSSSSLAVPRISSPIIKSPTMVSLFIINSETSLAPIWNLNMFSIIAVAPEVNPVICLPIKSSGLPTDEIALNIVYVSKLPSDIRNICPLG